MTPPLVLARNDAAERTFHNYGKRKGMLLEAPQKTCIVCNPVAGSGRAKRMLPEITALLAQKGVDFDVVTTAGPGEAETVARQLPRDEYRAIAAMGGDGTLNEVVNGILASDRKPIPVAAIPAGTGNDFVTGNHLFSHWSESIEALAKFATKKMDVMSLRDQAGWSRYAVSSVGIGIDAYVAKRVSELKTKKLGRLSYALETVRGLFSFEPFDMHVIADDVHTYVEKAWLCACMKSEYLGGGLIICPGACSSDGVLSFGYLSNASRPYLLRVLLHVFKGTHVGMRGVRISTARTLSVEPIDDVPCHLDGDIRNVRFPLDIKVVPEAIEFVVNL